MNLKRTIKTEIGIIFDSAGQTFSIYFRKKFICYWKSLFDSAGQTRRSGHTMLFAEGIARAAAYDGHNITHLYSMIY